MCEWRHLCNDDDSGQNMKKSTKTFFWFGNKTFCQKKLVTCYMGMDAHM